MADSATDPLAWFRKQMETIDPDLLGSMVQTFAEARHRASYPACKPAPPQRAQQTQLEALGYNRGTGPYDHTQLQKRRYLPDWLVGARRRPS